MVKMTSQQVFEVLEAVLALSNVSSGDTFRDIWGDRVGSHLWGKYVVWGYDFNRLYGSLDSGSRKVLAAYLASFYEVSRVGHVL